MNALDRRIQSTMNKLIAKRSITSEICYFKGLLDDQYCNLVRTDRDEQQMKIKIIILNEDMRKYMKNSYTSLSLPYNKEIERQSIQKPTVRFEEIVDDNDDQNSDQAEEDHLGPNLGCK